MEGEVALLLKGSLPKSCRKCPIAFESACLDQPRIREINLDFDSHLTMRHAKENIHMEYLIAQKSLDGQAVERHISGIQDFVKRKEFVKRCCAHVVGMSPAQQSSKQILGIVDSDEEDPSDFIDQSVIIGKVNAIYAKLLDKAASQKAKRLKEQQHAKDKTEEHLRQLGQKNPEDFMKDMIADVIKDKGLLKGKGKGKGKGKNSLHLQGMKVNNAGVVVDLLKGDEDNVEQIVQDNLEEDTKGKGGTKGSPSPKKKPNKKKKGNNKKDNINNFQEAKGKGKGADKGKGKGKNNGKGKGKGNSKSKNSWESQGPWTTQGGKKGGGKGYFHGDRKGKGKGKKW